VSPPFIITREEIDVVVAKLETVIDRVQEDIKKKGYLKKE
jgi:adenosylmethionine-8-amino-7-oxononanoate aminotransferase